MNRNLRSTMLVAVPAAMILTGVPFQAAQAAGSQSWVASWTASPSDDAFPTDPSLIPVPTTWKSQTVRDVIAPHLGGAELRLHLSNRFSSGSTTFSHVTIGYQTSGAGVSSPTIVTFGTDASVTVAPGQDVVSDPVFFKFSAFQPLTVSIYLSGNQGQITKHWDSNATTYYNLPFGGDLTQTAEGASFVDTNTSWFYLDGLDVTAPAKTRSFVAFGDSITDGFVSGSKASLPQSTAPINANGRYPDDLQRRLRQAGINVSVVNAGIGSNQLLTSSSSTSPGGPSGLSRLAQDALTQPGAQGIILLEGINDLGLGQATPATLEAGYTKAIADAHAAGLKIWIGTILPASNSVTDGTATAPNSEVYREQINKWIRSQTLADGVIDFAAALRNPAKPDQLAPKYASTDFLHPNLAGYQEMADIIPLSIFKK